MNKLKSDRRAQILNCLVEGNSIRATASLTGAAINTVVKMLVDAGRAFSAYQDETFRKLKCKRIQCDEIWAFVGYKEKGWGDIWTWAGIDPDSKLAPSWFIGTGDGGAGYKFRQDLAGGLPNRVKLTTEAHKPYLNAVEDAFGSEIDYAMLAKIYGPSPTGPERQ